MIAVVLKRWNENRMSGIILTTQQLNKKTTPNKSYRKRKYTRVKTVRQRNGRKQTQTEDLIT
jgi:hypothetical protein